jgi:NAD(P)H-hydrate epimerase
MRIVSAEQMREVDRRTVAAGECSFLELMEAAGRFVAECTRSLYPDARRIMVVCGKGNNGGDGLVAARYLAARDEMSVSVLVCGRQEQLSPDTAENLSRLDPVLVEYLFSAENLEGLKRELHDADVVIDALLGTGARVPVSGFYAEVIAQMNASQKPILSVDLPSGADADTKATGVSVRASSLATFTAPKLWHALSPDADVPTAVVPIGSPDTLVSEVSGDAPQLFTPADLPREFLDRRTNSNKGLYGHVLVVGGAYGKSGAPGMSGLAALRSGAGLVTVACPGSVLGSVAAAAPELMTEPLGGRDAERVRSADLSVVSSLSMGKSVLAVGPGLGRDPETENFVRGLAARCELPLVLDADGLNAFEGKAEFLCQHRSAHLVITPHPGEMARLTGLSTKQIQADRVGLATGFAREHRCTVVLKGWRTVVAFADGSAWLNPSGNPGMSKGGTGDALTGMVAAMLSQKPDDPQHAVLAAVYLHGLAADLLLPTYGEHGMLATDIIAAIPRAILALQKQQRCRYVWLRHVPDY